MQFFLAMKPPTATHQMKQIVVRKGKPVTYEPPAVADARATLEAHLAKHAPATPLAGPVELYVLWCFPRAGKHQNAEWRTSCPDLDNLQKLLQDSMTKLGFWTDDSQVASLICGKFWADTPGIFIRLSTLPRVEHTDDETSLPPSQTEIALSGAIQDF